MVSNSIGNIKVCENGILIAADGTVKEINLLDEIAYCLDEPIEELTKEYIIEHIIPVTANALNEFNLLDYNKNGRLDILLSLLVAYKDKLFYINNMFDITEIAIQKFRNF